MVQNYEKETTLTNIYMKNASPLKYGEALFVEVPSRVELLYTVLQTVT